jgi:hypothetical protein
MVVMEQLRHADTDRAEQRRQWFERVAQELEVATEWDASTSPDLLVGHLDGMADMASASDILTPNDKFEIRERVRLVKLKAYQKHADFLLEQAMTASRDKDRQQERGDLYRLVNDALNMAARLGIDPAVKQRILDRLDIIRETSHAGDSVTAKVNADIEAARFDPVMHPSEHRTFTRWRHPTVVVAVNGRSFSTVDWSLGGALLGEVDDLGWKCGQYIDVKIGLAAGKLHADKMVVVRYSPEAKRLAIRSRRFASVLMQVKRECESAGIEPV